MKNFYNDTERSASTTPTPTVVDRLKGNGAVVAAVVLLFVLAAVAFFR